MLKPTLVSIVTLDGRTEVIQRRRGAGSQAAFERAVTAAGARLLPPG